MADRTVYGLNFSENGWRMVDQGSCVWVKVPGTNVSLQIREGQPAKVLGAFAADFSAYVEPLRDGDSGCWTPTNSVASSNHLSGTGMDLNWNGPDGRTFRLGIPKERAYPGDKSRALDELIEFYEGMIFCGGQWSIRDWMHFQMGGNTYGAKNVDRVNDFIRRKIRPDGFSTFRRGGTSGQVPPPPPVEMSREDRYANRIIAEGKLRGVTPRGIKIALSVVIVESNFKMYANKNVPASLALPHDAVGSDHDSVGLYQQRYPMWGPLQVLMNVEGSTNLFFDRLVKMDYNNEARTPGSYAADVQRPAAKYRGRYQEQYGRAEQIYNRLTSSAPPPVKDDELSAEAERKIAELHEAFFGPPDFESLSPLRTPGEGKVGNLLEFIRWMDGNVHVILEILLTKLRFPDPDAITLLQRVKDNTDPERKRDAKLAAAILLEVGQPTAAPQTVTVTQVAPAQAAPAPEPEPEVYMPVRLETPAAQKTPEDLVDEIKRLTVFDRDYNQALLQLKTGRAATLEIEESK